MARTKVDNKLNVVIGKKAQILDDTTIPENSIVIVTDEELKASDTTYDNTVSEMTATTVQGAIDELDTQVELKVSTSDIVNNLTSTDTNKPLSANQGKVLNDTKENLSNKATNFDVVNDTKYPTTKAVSERLLNLPIAELNNHTLREVFEGTIPTLNNLITGSGPTFSDTTGYSPINNQRDSISVVNNKLRITALIADNNLGISKTPNVALTVNDVYYIKINGYKTSGGGTKSLRLQTLYPVIIYNLGTNTSLGFIATKTNTLFQLYVNNDNTLWQINDYWEMSSWVLFNLTASHGVTATSGTAYYDAVSEIEWILSKNDGYIQAVGNPFEIVDLTIEQMDYWFSVYQNLKTSETQAIFSLLAPRVQEAWITPTLTGATATYLKYRKDTFGEVAIEGNITITATGTVMTLPCGYRPLFNYTVGNITIGTNGVVTANATGSQTLSIRYTGA